MKTFFRTLAILLMIGAVIVTVIAYWDGIPYCDDAGPVISMDVIVAICFIVLWSDNSY